jgi:hypothetical protein
MSMSVLLIARHTVMQKSIVREDLASPYVCSSSNSIYYTIEHLVTATRCMHSKAQYPDKE